MIKMPRLPVAIAAIALLFGFYFTSAHAEGADTAQTGSVIVYYLHGGPRCPNCYNMENWTKELVEVDLKKEVDSGKLVFKNIDTDLKENQHFVKDYKLYTKTVIVSLVKDGKEVKYANLGKIWSHIRSKENFQAYVKGEIEKYLKEI